MGLFGVGEVLFTAEQQITSVYEGKLGHLIPRGKELVKGLWASVRERSSAWRRVSFPG